MDVINYINTEISTAAAYIIHNNIHSITTEFMRFHRKFIPCTINIIYEGSYCASLHIRHTLPIYEGSYSATLHIH